MLVSEGCKAEEADGLPENPCLVCSLMKELGILRKELEKHDSFSSPKQMWQVGKRYENPGYQVQSGALFL